MEAGNYAPSVYLALAIAGRLGTTVERLFGQEPKAELSKRTNDMEASTCARTRQRP